MWFACDEGSRNRQDRKLQQLQVTCIADCWLVWRIFPLLFFHWDRGSGLLLHPAAFCNGIAGVVMPDAQGQAIGLTNRPEMISKMGFGSRKLRIYFFMRHLRITHMRTECIP